jgi:hypothetical protein
VGKESPNPKGMQDRKKVAKNHSAGIRDMMGLIIKKLTQVPRERFRLR